MEQGKERKIEREGAKKEISTAKEMEWHHYKTFKKYPIRYKISFWHPSSNIYMLLTSFSTLECFILCFVV